MCGQRDDNFYELISILTESSYSDQWIKNCLETEIHPAKKPNVIRSTPSLQTPTTKRMLTTPNHMALSILGKRNYSHHNGLDAMEKRVRNLSLQEKFDVVKMITEEKKTVKEAVVKFKCGKTQIYTIMKEKEKIIEKYMSSTNVNVKKERDGNYAEINRSVFEWFLQASARNIPISGPILQAKAKEMAKFLKVDGFSASNGWLQSFKKKHGITSSVACEQSNEFEKDIQSWFTKLKEIIRGYDPKDIANADETALFYRAMPHRTLKMKGEECSRGRFSKERLTVLLTTFADGTFEKPWIIGKSEKPQCFRNIEISQLSVEWKWNKKAWMTGAIYEEFLNKLNNNMKKQNRSILLFVDNASCHRSLPLSNIKLIFFPPSTTVVLQPLDNGIIQNIKVNYRKLLLQKVIAGIEMCKMASETWGKIDILDAISFLKRSIKMIKEETVRKCFKNCGFLFGSGDSVQNETVLEPDNIRQLQDAINDIYSDVSEHRVSAACYIDIDKDAATEMEDMNLQDIVDLQSKDEDDEDDEDLPPEEPEPLSQTQVFNYIKALKDFGKVKGDQEFFYKAKELEICFNNFIQKSKQTKKLTLDVFIKK
ncbi:PREDICTED: tigger transposable element-derived protein 6-like [Elephantulus edwardii]|uniref:tigger transposable element-derived protein 6-like n=1 Tax=Elephantulus edwardii TaxID=28737 RepID=UPI0003F0966C|nr:PREDICTED: tigger transposable element-derived protein 6-like [Elephantulus edwardii]